MEDPSPENELQELCNPAPKSLPLIAALFLLDSPLVHKSETNDVFLISTTYLQNWIIWAYHQAVPQDEMRRLQAALRMSAKQYFLETPELEMPCEQPGPIDNLALSQFPKAPLLLRENVELNSAKTKGRAQEDENGNAKLLISAVPVRFYELLRNVHGIICEDGSSISFQADPVSCTLHFFPMPKNGHVRPIDFRRKVVLTPQASQSSSSSSPSSPSLPSPARIGKDARTDKNRDETQVKAEVELMPVVFRCQLVGEMDQDHDTVFKIWLSRTTTMKEFEAEVQKLLAPKKSSQCVRLWAHLKRSGATKQGDGYELIHFDPNLRGKPAVGQISIANWIRRVVQPSPEILVETRTNFATPWSRRALELENRLQVGDFVDAQDTTGKWYEAIIREVSDDTCTVHYLGWASKWDAKVRRRNGGEQKIPGVARTVQAPAPLWSFTTRWREELRPGDRVEIRDSKSFVNRPKWFRGTIIQVGKGDDTPPKGGATLEMKEHDGDKGRKTIALRLLRRQTQVLVEVGQEKVSSQEVDFTPGKECPPIIRWAYLYGEEICKLGTHLKIEPEPSGPATISYAFDPRKPPVEVLKSVGGMHGAGFVRESIRGPSAAPGSVGLQNLGNSCFMNSIVQCLNHIEQLTDFFLLGTYTSQLNKANPLGSGGNVSEAYASLLQEIWGGGYSTVAPRRLKRTIGTFAPQFNNVYQHDSHEFCSFLMDGIHEDCNRVMSKPYVEDLEGFGMPDEKVSIESWRKHLLRHDSIIVDHCQGMHRSHLTCPICGRESIKFDIYSSISLPIPQSKGNSHVPLEDCLQKFTEGEQLDENNAWYCPNCQKHVCALKMLALWSVPDILILHLKRFTYESKSGGVVRNKIEERVVFPVDNLDMSEYILGPKDDEAPPVYNLFGVSEHTGSTANSGHYTATVRNSKDGTWYRYNDSHVGTSSGEASVTGGAYLLFYKRAKGSARWAGMEKEMAKRNVDPHGALDADLDGFKQVKTKKGPKSRKS